MPLLYHHTFPTRRSSDLNVHIRRIPRPHPTANRDAFPRNGKTDGYLRKVGAMVFRITGFAKIVFVVLFRFKVRGGDRKSTRLNSSHVKSSYAVFSLNKHT